MICTWDIGDSSDINNVFSSLATMLAEKLHGPIHFGIPEYDLPTEFLWHRKSLFKLRSCENIPSWVWMTRRGNIDWRERQPDSSEYFWRMSYRFDSVPGRVPLIQIKSSVKDFLGLAINFKYTAIQASPVATDTLHVESSQIPLGSLVSRIECAFFPDNPTQASSSRVSVQSIL